VSRWIIAAGFGVLMVTGLMQADARADSSAIERGKYLVSVMSCTDCHTDGALIGKPDMEHFLGGSSIGFEIPGFGFFYGPNLTSDPETGLGSWSETQIATAFTKGMRPDGRELAPIMPWRSFSNLTSSDAGAIAAYLKSLPPVQHKVPGPFGANQKPTAPYMTVVLPTK
jgi:mono/diheme cytochrome c family protein